MNEGIAQIFLWAIGLLFIAAWLMHIITCLAAQAWGLLIAGALFFPIAIIHGIMIWLGMPMV